MVLVHGGFSKPGYDRSLEDAVAADLAGRGFLCWTYVAAGVAAGDDSRLVVVEGGRFEHPDPGSPASTALREALERLR